MSRLFDIFNLHSLILACLLLPTSMAFLGCDVDVEEGPAEEIGEGIDEVGEDNGD